MVKKLLTIALGLMLGASASATITFSASDVEFWVGSGSNSAVVVIAWDDNPNGNFALAWGVHWNGSATAANMLDSIQLYDERFTYSMTSSGWMTSMSYNDGELISGSSHSYWCYTRSGGSAGGYASQQMADGDLMVVSSSCNHTMNSAVAATNPYAALSCARVQSVSVTDITTSSVTVNVVDTAYVNDYTCKLFSGSTLIDSVEIYSQTYSFYGLSSGTTYRVEVNSNCSDGTTTNARTATFTTLCDLVELDGTNSFLETFDGITTTGSGILPNCWSTSHIAGTRTDLWTSYSASASSCHSGTRVMRLPDQQSGNITLLVSPAFSIATANQYQVSLWVKRTNSYNTKVNEGVKVWANHAPDTAGGTLLFHARRSITQSPAVSADGWYEYTGVIPLTDTVYIVMEGISEYGAATDIDDFSLLLVPSCDDPDNLAYDAATGTVSWTAGDASEWQVRDGETLTVVSTPSYSNPAWQLATEYTVSVRSICGAGDTNSWRNSVTFTTPRIICLDTMPLPFSTTFSGYDYTGVPYYANAPLPDCWQVLSNGTNMPSESSSATIYYSGIGVASSMNNYGCVTPNDPYFSFMAYAPYDGTYTSYTNNMNAYGTRKFAVLPRFVQPLNQLDLSFDYSMSARDGAELRIGYIVNDTSDFTSLYVAPTSYRTLAHVDHLDFAVLSENIPANARLAMLWLTTDTVHTGTAPANLFCGIDNLTVDVAPSCKFPRDFVADSIGYHGFSLGWREVSATPATQWQVAYGPQGFDPETEGTQVSVNATSTTVTGLTADNDYDAYVRSVCADGGYTAWAGPVSIHTPCPQGGNVILGTEAEEQMNMAFHNWGNTVCQTLFTADELSAAGLHAGDTVSNLSYDWHAGTTARYAKAFSLYMTHTAVTSFPEVCQATDWLPVTAADLVLNDTLTTTAIGLTRYDLTTPFVWNGTDGIAITSFVNQPDSTNQSSTGVYNISSSSPSRRTLYARRDHTAYILDSLTTVDPGSTTYRANILIERPCIDTIISDTTVTPIDTIEPGTITNNDILFWVGNGPDSAIVIINWVDEDDTPTTYAWGLAFDDEEGVFVSDVLDSMDTYDPRFYYHYSRYMGSIFEMDMVRFVDDNDSLYTITAGMDYYNCLKLDGTMLDASEFEDEWINPGSLIEISTDCYFVYGTVVPVTPPSVTPEPPADPVDATIAASDILYWVGTGSNSVVMAFNWGNPDTCLAWGVHFDGSYITNAAAIDTLITYDSRLSYTGTSGYFTDITFTEGSAVFALYDSVGNYWGNNVNGNMSAGINAQLHNGDFSKWGDGHAGIGYNFMDWGGVLYPMSMAWTSPVIPVPAPSTPDTTHTDTTAISADDILYWVGSGDQEAIFVLMDGNNARAWGYRFDADDEPTAMDMAVDIDAADPRLVYTMDYSTYGLYFSYKEHPITMSVPDSRFSVDGEMAEAGDMLSDYDLYDGSIVIVSSVSGDNWNTPIVPATEMHMPVNSTIDSDDILYWVGEGVNEAVVVVNWGVPDTALAWGLRFTGATSIANAIDSIANADPRVTTDAAHSTINYNDGNVNLTFQPAPASYMQFILDGNSNVNANSLLADGNQLKIGESAYGIGYDSTEYAGMWYPMGVVWNTEIHPVTVPDTTTTPIDTTATPVEATIAFSDILYWVGEGSNEAVMVVNWVDTALAWGYRFNGSATVSDMMADIAAADPRFSYEGSGYVSDIFYIDTAAGMTDTLRAVSGSWWGSTNNGVMDMGMGQPLANGDFEKWADGMAGVLVDSTWVEDYGGYWNRIYVYPMTIHPVTVPDTSTTPVIPEPEHGPFCGAVGTEGCNAIAQDSSAIVAWATGCTVVRGPVDITNPDGPTAHYGTDSMAIGPAGTTTTTAVSLGDGGTATLTFATPIRNGEGPDFAVFENSFNDFFLELAFVEVSSDGERFVRFPATSLTQTETQVGSNGSIDPTFINNLAGKFRVGYGTPFDLDDLLDSTGINLDSIVYVRIVDVVGTIDPEYATYDAFGHIVNDPWPTSDVVYGSGGFDLTGVAVLNEYVAPQPPVGIEETELAVESVWPNPTADVVNVTVSRQVSAVLFDQTGRQLTTFTFQQGRNTLDLSAFAAGVYILRAEGSVTKIVKR